MEDARVLVTGGTGVLGRLVVASLRAAGRSAVVLSRRPPAQAVTEDTWRVGDLATRAGLDAALDGVQAVVHCATSNSRADVAHTRHLVAAAARAGVRHVVYPSIVGVDRIPLGYYRAKLASEQVLHDSGLPCTVLRATQFHELLDRGLQLLGRLPVLPVPAGTSFQPVAAAEVADRLVALVSAPAAGRVADLGGPQVLSAQELAHLHLQARGRRRPVVGVRLPGSASAGYRRGDHLAPHDPAGRTTFAQWLAEHPR